MINNNNNFAIIFTRASIIICCIRFYNFYIKQIFGNKLAKKKFFFRKNSIINIFKYIVLPLSKEYHLYQYHLQHNMVLTFLVAWHFYPITLQIFYQIIKLILIPLIF